MKVTETALPGVLLVEPAVFPDPRGFFQETWQEARYRDIGVDLSFVQDNRSRSARGVLRGMHLQRTRPQGKLVWASYGTVFDVVVDVDPGSEHFGRWVGFELSDANARQLWIPPGYAHGFCVLSDFADFQYKCTDFYVAADGIGLRWDCPEVAIEWPVDRPLVSEADAGLPGLEAFRRGLA